MTAVVGVNFLSEVIVIADTRVSWPDKSRAPQDVVQKLYRIKSPRTPGKEAVLGYSGDLTSIRMLVSFLGRRKFEHYNRPLLMVNLKDDLRKWIGEATVVLDVKQRSGLKFMLCGIEPSRPVPIRRGTTTIRSPQILETHIYVFHTDTASGSVAVTRSHDFAVIGSGARKKAELRKRILPAIRFGFTQKNLHWARAVLVGEIANSVIQSVGIEGVGGPLQVVRISPDGLSTCYTWPDEADDTNVEVSQVGGVTVLKNRSSRKQYTLYPIWALPADAWAT